MSDIPRRSDIKRNHCAELAIRTAVHEVEAIGADVELTNIVVALDAIRERLADWLDRDANEGEVPAWFEELEGNGG